MRIFLCIAFAGAANLAAAVPLTSPEPVSVSGGLSAPLSGSVRFGSSTISGATVVVRGLSKGLESVVWISRTERDGTFVWPSAPAGVYALVAFLGTARASIREVRHDGKKDQVSFIPMELDRDPRILKEQDVPSQSVWISRIALPSDPLREEGPVLEPASAVQAPGPVATRGPAVPSEAAASLKLPLRASVASVAGRDIDAGRALSRTSIDVGGGLGKGYRWDLEGEYGRVSGIDRFDKGDSTRIALEIGSVRAPSFDSDPLAPEVLNNGHLRFETRRQALPFETASSVRVSEHSVDAVIPSGTRANTSVSARMVSQENFYRNGLVPELFARQSDALEIQARYRNDVSERTFVRASVAYRADSSMDPLSQSRDTGALREARILAGAGTRITDWFSVEGAVSGDTSGYGRSLTPEIALRTHSISGLRLFLSAAQRFEQGLDPLVVLPSQAGSAEADLTHVSRALYKAGIQINLQQGDVITLEGSHRQMASTFRFILDKNFIESIDSLYLFDGDEVDELSLSTTFQIGESLHARLLVRGGAVRGQDPGFVEQNEARFGNGEAAIRFVPTRTDIALRYRIVVQSMVRTHAVLNNDLEALEISMAQVLPIPFLRALGSEWKALLSFELGDRLAREERISSRRLSGGLGVSF